MPENDQLPQELQPDISKFPGGETKAAEQHGVTSNPKETGPVSLKEGDDQGIHTVSDVYPTEAPSVLMSVQDRVRSIRAELKLIQCSFPASQEQNDVARFHLYKAIEALSLRDAINTK